MASILEFRKSADQMIPSVPRDERGPAEIVLFPGIRYERTAEPCEAAQGGERGSNGPRRDRIELDS